MLVFLDETACDRRSSLRKFGYSLLGKRALSTSLLVHGVRYSAIKILTVEGIQDSYITSQNTNAEKFEDFVDKCLVPRLMPFNGTNPNSTVILDNASTHHVDHIVRTIQSVGALVHFLPPYSPDLNPMKEGFSKIKGYSKANEAAIPDCELENFILAGFASITKDDCIGWIKHAGYVINSS